MASTACHISSISTYFPISSQISETHKQEPSKCYVRSLWQKLNSLYVNTGFQPGKSWQKMSNKTLHMDYTFSAIFIFSGEVCSSLLRLKFPDTDMKHVNVITLVIKICDHTNNRLKSVITLLTPWWLRGRREIGLCTFPALVGVTSDLRIFK